MDRDMVRAAIGAEDSKFCAHNGFDVDAIQDAVKRNASGGRIRGGSTISQQTAKNAFLWQGGGYARKGVEAWFTFLTEQLWGKRRIMEVYFNLAETGSAPMAPMPGRNAISGMTRARCRRPGGADRSDPALPRSAARIAPKGLSDATAIRLRRGSAWSCATGSMLASCRPPRR